MTCGRWDRSIEVAGLDERARDRGNMHRPALSSSELASAWLGPPLTTVPAHLRDTMDLFPNELGTPMELSRDKA